MALPTNITTVTLSGTYIDLQGNPIRGQVKFTPRTVLVDADQDTILISASLTVSLDDYGSFTVVLPATDDPDTNPTGFTYKVEESFSGGRTFDIQLPKAQTVVNLADIVPAQPSTGTGTQYVSVDQYVSLEGRVTVVETAASPFMVISTAATSASTAAATAAAAAAAASAAAALAAANAGSMVSPMLLAGA